MTDYIDSLNADMRKWAASGSNTAYLRLQANYHLTEQALLYIRSEHLSRLFQNSNRLQRASLKGALGLRLMKDALWEALPDPMQGVIAGRLLRESVGIVWAVALALPVTYAISWVMAKAEPVIQAAPYVVLVASVVSGVAKPAASYVTFRTKQLLDRTGRSPKGQLAPVMLSGLASAAIAASVCSVQLSGTPQLGHVALFGALLTLMMFVLDVYLGSVFLPAWLYRLGSGFENFIHLPKGLINAVGYFGLTYAAAYLFVRTGWLPVVR